MSRRSASLHKRYPRRFDIPLLITVSAILIGLGLMLPAVETRALIWRNEYSVVDNMNQLSREGKQTAAVIIGLCSIAYPAVKLGLLSFFWLFPFPATWRWRSIQLLRLIGRWGMVDVFTMTAIVLASMTIGPLRASPKAGLFLYAAGILCLMFVGLLMSRMAGCRR